MLGQVHGRLAQAEWFSSSDTHQAMGWARTIGQWPPSNSSFPDFLCHRGCELQQSTTPYRPWISAFPLLLLPTSSLNPAHDWPQGSNLFPTTWTPCLCNQLRLPCAWTSGHPRWVSGKEPACQCRRCKRRGFDPWVGKISWRRAWWPTPVFWPGESHGQRSLAGYSPRGGKDLQWCLIPHIKKVIGFIEITGSKQIHKGQSHMQRKPNVKKNAWPLKISVTEGENKTKITGVGIDLSPCPSFIVNDYFGKQFGKYFQKQRTTHILWPNNSLLGTEPKDVISCLRHKNIYV